MTNPTPSVEVAMPEPVVGAIRNKDNGIITRIGIYVSVKQAAFMVRDHFEKRYPGGFEAAGLYTADQLRIYGDARAAAERQAASEDASRLDWLRDNFFTHRWNGVVGLGWRVDWNVVPHFRHIHFSDNTGDAAGNFRAAIDAARAAVKG